MALQVDSYQGLLRKSFLNAWLYTSWAYSQKHKQYKDFIVASKKSQSKKKQLTLSYMQVAIFVLIFAAVGTYAIVQSFAASNAKGGGKPVRGGANGLSMSVVNDVNKDGLPNYGDTITFAVSTTATTEPHVRLSCAQNGAVVYTNQSGYYPTYPWPSTQNMTLTSGAWTSGGADCTATWYYFNGSKTVDAGSLSFSVGA